MNRYFIESSDFELFIKTMLDTIRVIAPQAVLQPATQEASHKGSSTQEFFSFEPLLHESNLRLDYDITILPPKKVFFPPKQVILRFNKGQFEDTIKTKEQILFGVHPYDLQAISQTDFLFRENYEDINYTAYREATTIIGSNVQTMAKHAFWGSLAINSAEHDAFITLLSTQDSHQHNNQHSNNQFNGYVFDVLTKKGEALLSYGEFKPASCEQIKQAQYVNEQIKQHCPERLNDDISKISKLLRQSFSNTDLWDQLAKDCFSCGSCNTTCPTCYCFNIEDHWHINQVSGERTRYWDACMTEDFAKISLGDGQTENFRPTTGTRMRHRIMRKMVYLNDKLGSQACVGCGRCTTACTADIANPVDIINQIMEASHDQ